MIGNFVISSLQHPYASGIKLHEEVFGVGIVIVHTVHHNCSPSHNAFVHRVGLQGHALERVLRSQLLAC